MLLLVCGTTEPPHPCHLHIHPRALSLGTIPALSAFAVALCCESQGRSFAACNSKIMQRDCYTAKYSQPGTATVLQSWAQPSARARLPCASWQCQGELHPWELGSQVPLAEALLAEQGRISADPASSHTRSQQISHTDPKGLPVPAALWGDPLQSRGKLRFSFRAVWLSEGAAPGASDVSHPLPQAQNARTEAVALTAAQGTKVGRFLSIP